MDKAIKEIMTDLKNLIETYSFDGYVNNFEVASLQDWFDENAYLLCNEKYSELYGTINNCLDNGCVSLAETKQILDSIAKL